MRDNVVVRANRRYADEEDDVVIDSADQYDPWTLAIHDETLHTRSRPDEATTLTVSLDARLWEAEHWQAQAKEPQLCVGLCTGREFE